MNIVQWPTKNFGYPDGTHGRNGQDIVAIVDHIMQGWRATYHDYLANPDKNSATFSVYRDGHVEQHVPLGDAAWCNGPMAAPDLAVPFIRRCWEQHINPNLVTVSIEHEGLTGVPWPDVQVQASIWLHKYIIAHCPGIRPDRHHIVGHYQIDSVNKSHCPGTAFPWARLMEALMPTPVSTIPQTVVDYCQKHSLGTVRVGKGLSYTDEVQDGIYKTTSGAVVMTRHYDPAGDQTVQIDHLDWRAEQPIVPVVTPPLDTAPLKAKLDEATAAIVAAKGLLG